MPPRTSPCLWMILGCSKYGRLAANAIKASHAPSPATMTTTIAMIPAHDVPDNVGHLRLPVYPPEPINALIANSGRMTHEPNRPRGRFSLVRGFSRKCVGAPTSRPAEIKRSSGLCMGPDAMPDMRVIDVSPEEHLLGAGEMGHGAGGQHRPDIGAPRLKLAGETADRPPADQRAAKVRRWLRVPGRGCARAGR
jgi:hypothetical protein